MKKVAILTTFYEADSGFSLIAVVENQIKMLIDNSYEPIVIVQENFKTDKELWQPYNLDVRAVLPDLGAKKEAYKTVLLEHLQDVNVCITHDIILLSTYREHYKALKELDLDITYLHYIHSCPNPNSYNPPPGYIIYPNATDKARVIQAYRLAGQEHRVIPSRASHSINPLDVWNYDNLTRDIIDKFNLLDADISCVYPARLDRGKQPEKIIRLIAGIENAGYDAKLLIIDWQSAGKRFQKYIKELEKLTIELGIMDKVAFTSRLDDRCNQGVPRKVVTELMDLSNVYIHPSKVETYSLVVHEAILRGKLVCLNFDFPVMRELYGESAIYFDFSSDRVKREYHPDEQTFWNDEAKRLIREFYHNRALVAQSKARREWTPKAMWKDFERLLYLAN